MLIWHKISLWVSMVRNGRFILSTRLRPPVARCVDQLWGVNLQKLTRLIVAGALGLMATTAHGAVYQVQIAGTLAHGTDNFGLFGGGNLAAGQAWSAVYSFDDKAAGGTISAIADGNKFNASGAGPISAKFTMSGQTYNLGATGGEITRSANANYGGATFNAYGGVTPAAQFAHLELWFGSYGASHPVTGTDFRDPLNVINPPTTLGQFYAGYYNGGFNVTTNLNLQATSLAVSALSSGTPEPASWAMMLGGFGIAGASMRRSRTAMRVTQAKLRN